MVRTLKYWKQVICTHKLLITYLFICNVAFSILFKMRTIYLYYIYSSSSIEQIRVAVSLKNKDGSETAAIAEIIRASGRCLKNLQTEGFLNMGKEFYNVDVQKMK